MEKQGGMGHVRAVRGVAGDPSPYRTRVAVPWGGGGLEYWNTGMMEYLVTFQPSEVRCKEREKWERGKMENRQF